MTILKTSEAWSKDYERNFTILDPDGWDRKNFQYSWFEEEITRDEFLNRVIPSTCNFRNLDPFL